MDRTPADKTDTHETELVADSMEQRRKLLETAKEVQANAERAHRAAQEAHRTAERVRRQPAVRFRRKR